MDPQDQDAWDSLCYHGVVACKSWTCVEKTFAIELWKNNIDYIKETYHQIDETNVSRIQDMFIISAMRSGTDPDTSTFLFLNKRWTIDPRYVNRWNSNCLIMGCRRNPCLEMIKLLLESFRENVNCVDAMGNNCFLVACERNTNIDVIKYLAQSGTVDTMIRNNDNHNCFRVINKCRDIKERIKILEYLINETDVDIDYNCMKLETFQSVFPRIRNSERLNVLIQQLMRNTCDEKNMIKILNEMNPFLLNPENRESAGICCFERQYRDIKKLVNLMDQRIELSLDEIRSTGAMDSDERMRKNPKIVLDFTRQSEFLFRHGSEDYYGYKKTVYESILLLREISQGDELIDLDFDFTQGFTLQGNLPKQIISQYIASTYTGFFDTTCIEESEEHFIDFLKFIDQYPTIHVSIDKLEHWISWYIETYPYIVNRNQQNIVFLKMICDRYMMKRLCVVLHNLAYPG